MTALLRVECGATVAWLVAAIVVGLCSTKLSCKKKLVILTRMIGLLQFTASQSGQDARASVCLIVRLACQQKTYYSSIFFLPLHTIF
jgi:hypothetical protein